jgi:Cu+-exporting ATPase
MMRASKTIAIFAALAVCFGLALAAAQHPSADTAKDPVCGMDVKKGEAKAAFDYKGTTYYFCSVGCKDKFVQDPEKCLQKASGKTERAECASPHCGSKAGEMKGKCPHCGKDMPMPEAGKAQSCPMAQAMMAMKHGRTAMPHGQQAVQHGEMGAACCPMGGLMQSKDVELKVMNTKDGVQVTLSSRNAETVKQIQEHLAMMAAKMKAGGESKSCGGDCLDK